MAELAFHGIDTSRRKAKSVTHVSGTECHLCLGPLSSPLYSIVQSTAKTTLCVTKAVAASSAMLPLVTTQTVGFARGVRRTDFREGEPRTDKLKPLDVDRETRPGKYPDGDGLYLVVASATSKNWSYRYWKDGKQRWLGLGSLKDVSLKNARLARDAARLRVKGDRSTPGVDIVQEKRAAREEAKAVEITITRPTFEQCAEIYIREHWSIWSRKHRNQWPSSLKRYAYATIGKLTIPEIKPSHVYELLRPIWVEKRETANRVRGRIETIIARNVDVDNVDFRNPAEFTKQLREKLPRRPKRVIRHHPALPYAEASQFMTDLSAAAGTAASMLCYLIFTATVPTRL